MASIQTSLFRQAGAAPAKAALAAPGRCPLTYSALAALIEQASADLRRFGVAPGERVALIAPNGPEMAAAFLAITSVASCAPLNPAYRAEEFAFYLEDLRASTLVVAEGMAAEAVQVARDLGLRLVELRPDTGGAAGSFTFCGTPAAAAPAGRVPGPEDEALVLHTSGTTSRPKLVPLSHGNLVASARAIRTSLELTPDDRCLNVMPLFHVHGLVAALLASLEAGAEVACCPGFVPARFFEWMDELAPTWYTAVPTMHRMVFEAAEQNRGSIARSRLRFIRSCSAALPPTLMASLESAFGVPVIEAYGMTEAAHQIASNPLPPRARKPGSVGVAAGPEIAVMDAAGVLLPRGQSGEVVIRGPNVTAGYEGNPEANASAFTNGWFRTGDEGYLDEEGYLFLTGRLKELINRGGEKIAPREIDEALLAHPAVAQAVAFAVPHSKLGEAVAAAVTLNGKADELELRNHAAGRLAHFKVPERIFIVESLPKGPTGKLQRIGLAEKLGVTEADLRRSWSPQANEPPRNRRERILARCFAQVLSRKELPGIHDNFFTVLGGDSLKAAELMVRVEEETGVAPQLEAFFANPTVAGLASALDASGQRGSRFLVAVRASGTLPPLVCIPGARGDISGFYNLARRLHPGRPVYALRSPRARGPYRRYRIEDLAQEYLEEVLERVPQQEIALLGVCAGAPATLELAHRLTAAGRRIKLIALLDSYNVAAFRALPALQRLRLLLDQLRRRAAYIRRNMRGGGTGTAQVDLWRRFRAFCRVRRDACGKVLYRVFVRVRIPLPKWLQNPHYACVDAGRRYNPAPWDGPGLLLRVEEPRAGSFDLEGMGWSGVFTGGYELKEVPGGHLTCLKEPYVGAVAAQLEQALASKS
ncbi:MAG TPA: AMP-binding protein [Bryobacteraceae bacterium]|nr:AMP-binding protein [Bryobacteraceae bacterium]HPU73474.1 AMP-binding protein [Bryobacteraceae bacterium]